MTAQLLHRTPKAPASCASRMAFPVLTARPSVDLLEALADLDGYERDSRIWTDEDLAALDLDHSAVVHAAA